MVRDPEPGLKHPGWALGLVCVFICFLLPWHCVTLCKCPPASELSPAPTPRVRCMSYHSAFLPPLRGCWGAPSYTGHPPRKLSVLGSQELRELCCHSLPVVACPATPPPPQHTHLAVWAKVQKEDFGLEALPGVTERSHPWSRFPPVCFSCSLFCPGRA